MKKLSLNFPILLILILLLSGCAQNKKDTNVENDIAAIKAMYDKYLHCVNTDDLDNFITAWADDAIRMEPGIPSIVGKENIRANFKKKFDMSKNDMVYCAETEVQVLSNDMAYGYGAVTLTSTPKEGGPATRTDIKWLDILKKQDDGSWKIFLDCINFHPTWSMDSIPSELPDEQNPFY
jgi:uncharacterized protein (TIGR02246 family)